MNSGVLNYNEVLGEKMGGACTKCSMSGGKKINAYAQFVKENYHKVQKENPNKKFTDIVKMVAKLYKESKEKKGGCGGGGDKLEGGKRKVKKTVKKMVRKVEKTVKKTVKKSIKGRK